MKRTTLIFSLVATLLLGLLLGHAWQYIPSGYKYVQHQREMQVDRLDTDKVTLADIDTCNFTLTRTRQTGPNTFFWQLRSDNKVINFEHVPDNLFWKWNVGEIVDKQVIQRILYIDAEIKSNQWDLHKRLQ